MIKKRIMIIGPAKSGKTTLANYFNKYDGKLKCCTQDVIYGKNTIDVPGAYIENSWMYKNIIATAQNAAIILLLIDKGNSDEVYSPGFTKVFKCPVIGVITKSDLEVSNKDKILKQFERLGVKEPYFYITYKDLKSFEKLKKYIMD